MAITPEEYAIMDAYYSKSRAKPKASTFGFMQPVLDDVARGSKRAGLGLIDLAADYAPETTASVFGTTPEKLQAAMDSSIDKTRQESTGRGLSGLPGEMLGDPLVALPALKLAYGAGGALMGGGQGIIQPTKQGENRAINAMTGVAFGYGADRALTALGAAGRAVTNKILPQSDQAVITGALDAGLPVTAGQAYGGEVAPRVEGYLRQAPIGGSPLRQKGEALADTTAAFLDAATPQKVTAGGAARALRTGGTKASEEIQTAISTPYDVLLKNLPADVGIPTPNAKTALDAARLEFQYNPKALAVLNDPLFENIASGNIPGGVLKQQLRKQVDAIANSGSARDLGLSSRIGAISKGMNDDVRSAVENGFNNVPGVAGAGTIYKAADRRYRAGKNVIDDILSFTEKPNASDEQLVTQYLKLGNQATTKTARGADAQLFSTLQKRLPKQTLDKLESYRISQLGRNERGDFDAAAAVREFRGLTPKAQAFAMRNLSPDKRKAWQSTVDYVANIKGTLNPSGTAASASETTSLGQLAMAPVNWMTSKILASNKVARAVNKLPREILNNPITPRAQQMLIRSLVIQGIEPNEAKSIATPPPTPEEEQLMEQYYQQQQSQPAPVDNQAPMPVQAEPVAPQSSIMPEIQKASQVSGIDPELLTKIATRESSLNPNAQNPDSSAAGLFQITNKTWRSLVKKHGKQYGIGYSDRKKPEANAIMAGMLAKENAASLKKRLGQEPTPGEIYMAHFLGDYAAAKLIKNKDSRNAAAALFPDAAKVNRNVFYAEGRPITAAQLYKNLSI